MDNDICIIEKPDWITWDSIHDVIWESHAENRRNGVVMRYPSLPGDEIKEKLGKDGTMLVAIDKEGVLVGTAAMMPKNITVWFGKHVFAYCCFASILPQYNGKGIYKEMCHVQEMMAAERGIDKMLFDTHEKNVQIIRHAIRAGYKFVDFKYYKDHYNVVLVKWLDGCPYSDLRCKFEFMLRKVFVSVKHTLFSILHRVNK